MACMYFFFCRVIAETMLDLYTGQFVELDFHLTQVRNEWAYYGLIRALLFKKYHDDQKPSDVKVVT